VSTSTSDESLVVQEASARLNRWQAIWLLLLIQLMAVLAVVSSQPVGFSWLSWRDLPGLLLLVIAIVLQLTTASFENTDSHQANRRVKVLFVIPLITWIGLWGHQSVVAQVVGGLALLGLGLSTGVPASHFLSLDGLLRPILDSSQRFMGSDSWSQHSPLSEDAAQSHETPWNEPSDVWQQTWNRERDEAGDRISGRATFDFPAGQRTAWYHLPIWPLMTKPPLVQLDEPLGQVTGKVRATQVETYGVRLELKLDRAPENDERMYVDFWLEADKEPNA